MCICTAGEPGTQGSQKGTLDPETEVTDDCEPPRGFWEPKPCPLQDKQQQVLLTTEPSLHLQSLTPILNIGYFSRTLFSSLYLATCRVFAYICVCTSVQRTRRLDILLDPDESGTVIDCGPPSGCWEWNLILCKSNRCS